MLDWKAHGDLNENPAITIHVDTTAVGTYHDLHQILFIENMLHEMFYVARSSTDKRIDMLVGTNTLMQDIIDLRLEDIDKAIECLFTFPTKTSKYLPVYDHAFTRFIGDYGHLYSTLIPTMVYIVITFLIPTDHRAFLKRQSKNSTVLTVIILIKDADDRYNKPVEIWRKASAEYRNVRFIALDSDSDIDEATRNLL